MLKQLINAAGSEATYESFQFSQAVRIGETIHVSGQVGYGPRGIPDGKEDQCRLAFGHLQSVLAEAGANLSDVVSMTSYHTDLSDFKTFTKVQREFIPKDFPPHTAVGVSALMMPAFKCEIAVIAVVGQRRRRFIDGTNTLRVRPAASHARLASGEGRFTC